MAVPGPRVQGVASLGLGLRLPSGLSAPQPFRGLCRLQSKLHAASALYLHTVVVLVAEFHQGPGGLMNLPGAL